MAHTENTPVSLLVNRCYVVVKVINRDVHAHQRDGCNCPTRVVVEFTNFAVQIYAVELSWRPWLGCPMVCALIQPIPRPGKVSESLGISSVARFAFALFSFSVG